VGCPAMDRGERLGRALDAFGGDLWALVDAALDAASRDRPDELRAHRDGIVERLYAAAAAAGCSNCNGRPPPVAALVAAGLDEEDGEEAAPGSSVVEADAQAGGAEEQAEEIGAGAGAPGLERKIVAIRDFLDDPNQVPNEAIFTTSQHEFAPNARSFSRKLCTLVVFCHSPRTSWCACCRTWQTWTSPTTRYRSSSLLPFCSSTSVIWLTQWVGQSVFLLV